MSTPVLRIGHGNGHNEKSLVDYIAKSGADSFSAMEAQRLRGPLEQLPHYRLAGAGEGWSEKRNRAQETAILTRDSLPNIGELTRQVSERIAKHERVCPDRVMVASFYEHPLAHALGKEGIAHFALHPDAGPAQLNGNDPGSPIVQEYREALLSTQEWMRTARRDGLLLVLTGDLQVSARNNTPWGPRALLAKPLHLSVRTTGIDWIMVDQRLTYAAAVQTHRLFDHTGFVATLKARG